MELHKIILDLKNQVNNMKDSLKDILSELKEMYRTRINTVIAEVRVLSILNKIWTNKLTTFHLTVASSFLLPGINLCWPKRTAVKFQEESQGIVLMFDFIFWWKSPKNTLLSFKRQKRTQLLRIQFQRHGREKRKINARLSNHIDSFSKRQRVTSMPYHKDQKLQPQEGDRKQSRSKSSSEKKVCQFVIS